MERERTLRKRALPIWLLIPIGLAGAVGAWATGLIGPDWPMLWQSPSDPPQIRTNAIAGKPAPATASGREQTLSPNETANRNAPQNSGTQQAALPVDPQAPAPASDSLRKVGIDVARILPEGYSVIAGFAKPSSRITILADGVPVGTTASDPAGDWVLITPHKFASLSPKLEIKTDDLAEPKLAALRGAAPNATAARPGTDKPREDAASVTRDMMRRLEELTAAAVPQSTVANATKQSPGDPSSVTSEKPPSPAPPAAAPNGRLAAVAPSAPASSLAPNAAAANLADPQPARQLQGLPVPVQFEYRTADFTANGRDAAALLLKYFKAKQFQTVALSGHADERGSDAANMALSQQRLERIEQFLRDGGFAGELKLVPKGSSEEFSGVDRKKFPVQDLYQLDRRVEVISAR